MNEFLIYYIISCAHSPHNIEAKSITWNNLLQTFMELKTNIQRD